MSLASRESYCGQGRWPVSTYYYLGCKRCKNNIPLVGRWFPDRWYFMGDDKDVAKIPAYVATHEDHPEDVVFFSEHQDALWDQCETRWGEQPETQSSQHNVTEKNDG